MNVVNKSSKEEDAISDETFERHIQADSSIANTILAKPCRIPVDLFDCFMTYFIMSKSYEWRKDVSPLAKLLSVTMMFECVQSS